MNLTAFLQQRTGNQEIDAVLSSLEQMNSGRLWNDLGLCLLNLVYTHRAYNAQTLLNNVFSDLGNKLDAMVLLELLDVYLTRENTDLSQKLDMAEKMNQFIKKDDVALVYLDLIKAKHMMIQNDVEGAMNKIKETETQLLKLRNFPKLLYSVLNFVKSDYYWRKEDFQNYHQTILQFLVYTDNDKLSLDDQKLISERTVLSALVSDKVLSFGDILESPFISILKDIPDKQILWQLVEIFNSGKVSAFTQFVEKNRVALNKLQFTPTQVDALDRKIRVIALYDAIFYTENSFSKQKISFKEVANITNTDELAVERLLIHVLSIELIKGHIDEPNNQLIITELKPRDLDRERLTQLREKYKNWQNNISQTLQSIKI